MNARIHPTHRSRSRREFNGPRTCRVRRNARPRSVVSARERNQQPAGRQRSLLGKRMHVNIPPHFDANATEKWYSTGSKKCHDGNGKMVLETCARKTPTAFVRFLSGCHDVFSQQEPCLQHIATDTLSLFSTSLETKTCHRETFVPDHRSTYCAKDKELATEKENNSLVGSSIASILPDTKKDPPPEPRTRNFVPMLGIGSRALTTLSLSTKPRPPPRSMAADDNATVSMYTSRKKRSLRD